MKEDHRAPSLRLSKSFREELIANEDPLRFEVHTNGFLDALHEAQFCTGLCLEWMSPMQLPIPDWRSVMRQRFQHIQAYVALQIRCEAVKAVSGGFDSHALPPTYEDAFSAKFIQSVNNHVNSPPPESS